MEMVGSVSSTVYKDRNMGALGYKYIYIYIIHYEALLSSYVKQDKETLKIAVSCDLNLNYDFVCTFNQIGESITLLIDTIKLTQ